MWARLPEGALIVRTDDGGRGGIRGECQCGCRGVIFSFVGPPALDSFTLAVECPSCLAALMVSGVKSGLPYTEAL